MLYRFAKMLLFIYLHILYRIDVTGIENIPKDGGFVLCANHIHAQDPLVIGTSIKRRVYFLAKKELFKNKFFSAVLQNIGAVPVDRDATDIDAYRKAMEILKKESGLGIFAQGTRYKNEDDTSAKSGVALFALKSGVPVVPVGISSEYRLFSKITVNVGVPMYLEEYKGQRIRTELLETATQSIMSRVFELCKK